MSRIIVVMGSVDVNDDDATENEWCHYVVSNNVIVGEEQRSPLLQISKVCGGDVRIEIDLSAIALNNGDAQVSGTAKLFEGKNGATTDDLDDHKNIDFLLPANQPFPFQIKLKNHELGQDDSAEIKLSFSNYPVE
jgi:hypothetical protein